jgi:ATP-dependent DNA helicase RecG
MMNLCRHYTIKKYGSGIGRIINYFKEANSPLPTFENHSSGFLVTAFAANNEDSLGNVTENVIENVIENVTENRTLRILDAIRNNPKITTTKLSEQLQITRMTLHRDLEKLKNDGIIERIGPDKGGYWKVVKN